MVKYVTLWKCGSQSWHVNDHLYSSREMAAMANMADADAQNNPDFVYKVGEVFIEDSAPSGADLDAHAADQTARERTAGGA